MNKKEPLVSVIIPSYNHQKYVEETIRSIWHQAYSHLEIVVVDDYSTDNSLEILNSLKDESPLPFKLYTNTENLGISKTLNIALSHATGDLICFIASDDVFSKDRFSSQLKFFKENPSLKLAYANGIELTEKGEGGNIHSAKVKDLLNKKPSEILYFLYTNVSPIFIQTALIDAQLIKSFGGFNDEILADDWYLNTKMFEGITFQNEYTYINENVISYRRHDNNIHKNNTRHIALKLQFIEKVTPARFKNIACSNINMNIANDAMKRKSWKESFYFFVKSQTCQFKLKGIFYLLKFSLKYLKNIIKH